MSQFASLTSRGLLALPASLRRRVGLDRPGAQVEIVERDDGVIELRPHVPVLAEQAWYWTQRWQEREREVDKLVSDGKTEVHDDARAFLSHLDSLDTEPTE